MSTCCAFVLSMSNDSLCFVKLSGRTASLPSARHFGAPSPQHPDPPPLLSPPPQHPDDDPGSHCAAGRTRFTTCGAMQAHSERGRLRMSLVRAAAAAASAGAGGGWLVCGWCGANGVAVASDAAGNC